MDADGRDLPNGEIGEMLCKGPGVIKEYWNDPDMTATKIQDGWWKSGDLAYMKDGGHADGLVYLVDRKDDMLVCGGYNIYPSEVESYLVQNPKILQAVVIGIPDKVKGEIPKAFIIPAPGQNRYRRRDHPLGKGQHGCLQGPRQVALTTIDELPKRQPARF